MPVRQMKAAPSEAPVIADGIHLQGYARVVRRVIDGPFGADGRQQVRHEVITGMVRSVIQTPDGAMPGVLSEPIHKRSEEDTPVDDVALPYSTLIDHRKLVAAEPIDAAEHAMQTAAEYDESTQVAA